MSKYRVLRGGSYLNVNWRMGASHSDWVGPVFRYRIRAFRIVVKLRRKP